MLGYKVFSESLQRDNIKSRKATAMFIINQKSSAQQDAGSSPPIPLLMIMISNVFCFKYFFLYILTNH